MDLMTFVISRQLALNVGADNTSATRHGLVGSLLNQGFLGPVVARELASRDVPAPTPVVTPGVKTATAPLALPAPPTSGPVPAPAMGPPIGQPIGAPIVQPAAQATIQAATQPQPQFHDTNALLENLNQVSKAIAQVSADHRLWSDWAKKNSQGWAELAETFDAKWCDTLRELKDTLCECFPEGAGGSEIAAAQMASEKRQSAQEKKTDSEKRPQQVAK